MGKSKGITLIALVITIIIMLILAGVSLNSTIGENGIILQAMYSKFATEIKTIEEKIQMKQAISNSIYSGSINDLLEENNKYNDKLLIEDNELKYISSTVSSLELKWLEQLGIRKSSDYFTIEFDTANGEKIPNQTIRAGKEAKKPPSPTKSGYEFMGWYYLKENGTEEEPTYEEIEFNFNTKIVDNYQLYAKYAGEAVMMSRPWYNAYFWEYREKIKNISFSKGEIPNELPTLWWNVKANNNCADIIAYLEGNEENGYDLTIISPQIIYANPSCLVLFQGFTNLETINFDNFDTSKVNTMQQMFQDCYSLKNLNLKDFDTSNVSNMRYLFYQCQVLKSIILTNWNTTKVTSMYGMFGYCKNVENLDLSSFDTSNVKDMGAMFFQDFKLTNLHIENFDTSQVTNMNSMFANCYDLKELDLNHFNTQNVTTMMYMFCACENLKILNVNSFNTENVTTMYYMFNSCKMIETLDISSFDTKNVTDMHYMFCYCENLDSIYVGKLWNTEQADTSGMFLYCKCKDVSLKDSDI